MARTPVVLPDVSSFSNVMLHRAIVTAREILLARRRPLGYQDLTRAQWEKEKHQLRFRLGMYTELLNLRLAMARVKQIPCGDDRKKSKSKPAGRAR